MGDNVKNIYKLFSLCCFVWGTEKSDLRQVGSDEVQNDVFQVAGEFDGVQS